MRSKVIAIIPARGGSKDIPRKNIKLLAGKPLIAYTIEAALDSRYIDKIIVSTEDKEIADISNKYGAGLIERPRELAGDESPTIEVVFHALNSLGKTIYNSVIVLLQPTSPLRDAEDIDNSVELFMNCDCESVVSVREVEHSPYWTFKMEGQYLKPLFEENYLGTRRQDLPISYIPNGAIYISTTKELHKYKSFYCDRTIPYVMPAERSVDIDNEIDFMLAELLMKRCGS